MDARFWFGWLLKGKLEVSLLDRLLGLAELVVIVVVFILVWTAWCWVVDTWRRLFPHKK